jgi:REP element-mobilizing transposase RayT
MARNNNLPYRQSHRLPGFDYRQPGAYFITVCTHRREPLFGHIVAGQMQLNAAGQMVKSVWDELPMFYPGIEIDEFIVMPDHVHGIIHIVGALLAAPANMGNITGAASSAPTLGQIIRRFKSQSAIAVNRCLDRSMTTVWQRNYWERIIRSPCEYQAVCTYIRNNPGHSKQK